MTVSRKSFILGTASLSTTTLLAACGRSKSASSTTSGKTISIKHVYGTTEVPADATKVATVAWANQDVLLALGIMPLGFSKQTWGVTDGSGMLPWTKEKVDELTANGAAQPKLFDDDGGVKINPQAVKEDYDKLSKIAPTVAYPKVAWGTPWRETIAINATAVGKKTEGDTLVADLEKQVADAVAKHPQIKGKAAAFCYTAEGDATKFGYYTTADPRTAFLPDLGMKVPASVEKTSKENASAFNVDISTENADSLNDFDLIVMYGTESDLAAMQANSLLSQVRAIKNGAVAFVGNSDPMAASTNPGPLSIPWGIEKYVGLIATAAGKVK